MDKRIFTEAEKSYLINNFANAYSINIANELGMSLDCVKWKARSLGLRKSKEFLAIIAREKTRKMVEKNNGKKKPNKHKGMKAKDYMSPEAYARGNWFAKGNTPPNKKEIGHERFRAGYIEVKVADYTFMPKHRIVFEQYYGIIPDGYMVCFKDGNPKNLDPENLILKTRSDMMLSNSVHRFSPDLQRAIFTLSKLYKKIKQYENAIIN